MSHCSVCLFVCFQGSASVSWKVTIHVCIWWEGRLSFLVLSEAHDLLCSHLFRDLTVLFFTASRVKASVLLCKGREFVQQEAEGTCPKAVLIFLHRYSSTLYFVQDAYMVKYFKVSLMQLILQWTCAQVLLQFLVTEYKNSLYQMTVTLLGNKVEEKLNCGRECF